MNMTTEITEKSDDAVQSGVDLPPSSLLAPEERVLSTLNRDGTRRWLSPKLSRGRFLEWRRWTAYALIAIFTLIPHIRINDRPAMLLDLSRREFTFFGLTLLPTDSIILAFFLLTAFVGIFVLTALFGRVWCGWACPQTVYMEFLYRPIERLFVGTSGRGGPPREVSGLRRIGLYFAYLLASLFLAHTFLAYFVGVDALSQWVRQSPFEHPGSFLVMATTTALMVFNFTFFREQTCLVACPYGRFQSALLDRNSLIISYDAQRGEPRGRKRAGDAERGLLNEGRSPAVLPVIEAPRRESSGGRPTSANGDCIDCKLCVTTCPTGIDIRSGLQMECIGCAQCIDACDAVMDKIGRPRGLIRYSSQARIAGEPGRLLRVRVILYAIILIAALSGLIWNLSNRQDADTAIIRGPGMPFTELARGEISNPARLRITNRTHEARQYTVRVADDSGARIEIDQDNLRLQPGQSLLESALLVVPFSAFKDGACDVRILVSDGAKFEATLNYHALGPHQLHNPNPGAPGSAESGQHERSDKR
ncbi:MAG: 4Fe-4S binding protein [Phycisphaerales bacterium]|nr:4Fe-4S binding protein [Phycisphaerales bacterium]